MISSSAIKLILPLLIFNIVLIVVSLRDIFKNGKFKHGNKAMWIVLVIFVQILGPLSYFLIGRDD